ncbi:MAG: SGNH/GDSL hydrolase family protein [Actinomycetota bacterium]|nr:SGNH/GDSL hydrolase family protein [Actinomycetota bacterium]
MNPDRSVSVYGDSSVTPYDGGDDTLVGVLNLSSAAVDAITVTGPGTGLGGLDGDGLCSFGVAGCPFGPTGYEGPGTSLVTKPSLPDDAETDFTGGLAQNVFTYFSLEGALTSAQLKGREGHIGGAPYAGLGDSFSSGEGASSFLNGTDTGINNCHRAATTTAWEPEVSVASGKALDFGACSGAVVEDFYRLGDPARHTGGEVPQIDRVSTQGTTQLVTLTVGGNNLGFPNILNDCVEIDRSHLLAPGRPGCADRDQDLFLKALKALVVGRKAGCLALPGLDLDTNKPGFDCSDQPVPALSTLYRDIAGRLAQNGTLVVAGYPQLFGYKFSLSGTFSRECKVGFVGAIAKSDVLWMNGLAPAINATINSQVARAAALVHQTRPDVTIKFVSVDEQFQTHRLCDTGTQWIHGLELNGTKPSSLSFHPTDEGQNAYGTAVKAAL